METLVHANVAFELLADGRYRLRATDATTTAVAYFCAPHGGYLGLTQLTP